MPKVFTFCLGVNRCSQKEATLTKNLAGASVSLDLCSQSRDVLVRIIHAGGREELFQCALPASQLMKKYPGMCVARPEVFKNPWESLLQPEELLLPGHKYVIIPCTTAAKLKLKHMAKVKANGYRDGRGVVLDANITWDESIDISDESFYSAKEFYACKDGWQPKYYVKRSVRTKKPFVPPLPSPRFRSVRGSPWEPNLTSVQELSP